MTATLLSSPHGRALSYMPQARFLSQLGAILGNDRILWTPGPNDGLTAAEASAYRRTVTHGQAPGPRLQRLGAGYALSFASASTQYVAFQDAANLTFGTGAADTAFSVIALANVTDTAASRTLASKWNTGAFEYLFRVDTTDKLCLFLANTAGTLVPTRVSDAVISQGSWRVFGASYSGVGGATAADGIVLYQDGAVIASTATNNASYVAMSDTATPVEIGSHTAHTAQFFDGSLALVAITQKALTTADHAAITAACRRYFGVPA